MKNSVGVYGQNDEPVNNFGIVQDFEGAHVFKEWFARELEIYGPGIIKKDIPSTDTYGYGGGYDIPKPKLLGLEPYEVGRGDLLFDIYEDDRKPSWHEEGPSLRIIQPNFNELTSYKNQDITYPTLSGDMYKSEKYNNLIPSKIGLKAVSHIVKSNPEVLKSSNASLYGTQPLTSLPISAFSKYQGIDLSDEITPEGLVDLAEPVLSFIDRIKPHVIVGCDRGGRMFSLAVHALWHAQHPGEPFPTVDGKIHFARISKAEDPKDVQAQFDKIIELAKSQGRNRGMQESELDQLRILFIDDWVNGGGTRRLTERLVGQHGATSYFAVMRGGGADVSGMPHDDWIKPGWSDRPEEIGVNYISLEENDTNVAWQFGRTHKVVAIRSPRAKDIRRRMRKSASTKRSEVEPEAIAV